MKELIVVIPMGGLGSRFSNEGYEIPKPLIRLNNGLPMFINAALSFVNFDVKHKVIFVMQEELKNKYKDVINEEINKYFGNYKIVTLPKLTRGAAETVYKGIIEEADNNPLLTIDCDLDFKAPDEYIHNVRKFCNDEYKEYNTSMLLSFKSDSDKYSYAKLKEGTNIVEQTAEKKVISTNALIGAYFFNTVKTFKWAFRNLVMTNKEKELYISSLYNIIIENKLSKVLLYNAAEYHSYGTPEEFKLNNV